MLKKAAISLGLFAEYALFQLLLNLGKIANASNRVKQALGAFLVILTFYSALVTDFDLPAVTVWRTYRGRADCENRIKELKYDFAADSFNMKDFWATEAALNTVMLAYNLMSLMRQVLLKNSAVKHSSKTVQHTLQ
ncbi:MAG: transposase, partial [Candidatus Nitrotoga sp.]